MAWIHADLDGFSDLLRDIDTYEGQLKLAETAYGPFLCIWRHIIKQHTLQTDSLAVVLSVSQQEMHRLMVGGDLPPADVFKREMHEVLYVNREFAERRPALQHALAALVSALRQAHQCLQELWVDKGIIENGTEYDDWHRFCAAISALPVVHAPPLTPSPQRPRPRSRSPPLVPPRRAETPPRVPPRRAKRVQTPPRRAKRSQTPPPRRLLLPLLLHRLRLL
jgi:hypothetical protein